MLVFMNPLQQNIMYVGILIAVVSFFLAIGPKAKYEPQAVYLPQTREFHFGVKLDEVIFYAAEEINLRKALPVVTNLSQSPIGIIRVDMHYTNKKEIQAACEKSMQKAKLVAVKYGATKIIGNCFSSGNRGPLDSANFYAYAYR